jgi:UDP-arabinose 4-epimerase
MSNILITGGAGYIGSHVCKMLAEEGHTPIAYDNLSNGNRDAVQWGPFEEGDILDQDKLRYVLKKYQPDAVMHFAAFAYVGESIIKPKQYYRNNVVGTLNIAECMLQESINNLIFSGSCATFGAPENMPINETFAQNPISPYGRSKVASENIINDFSLAHGLRSIILRYFNAAGADKDLEIGELHSPETHLIPLLFDACTRTTNNFNVNGDDYDTSDGTCIRDYIHVTDLADAHILAYKKLKQDGVTTSYNLGNGEGFSIKQVIHMVEKVTGLDVPFGIVSRRVGDPPILIADSTKARKELLWSPVNSSLENIIESAWLWYNKMIGRGAQS